MGGQPGTLTAVSRPFPDTADAPGGGEPIGGAGEDSRKLTVYFGERSPSGSGGYLANDLMELFGRHRIATSILLRGIEGFGIRHHLRTDQSLSLSEDPPLVAVAVDTTDRIGPLLDDVDRLRLRGLVTVERARLLRGELGPIALPEELHEATKLTVYVGRQDRVEHLPAYLAVCDLLHRRGLAGASVFLGVDGTSHGRRERARFFDRNADVPTMIIAVGSGERVAAVLPELGMLLGRPMLTVERVRVCKRDGVLLERPHALPGIDSDGLALWQKVMVYTSESTLYHGDPVHRSLIRALRSTGAARGATALRGVWGFHGGHPPHGDRFLQLRRRVPVTTVIVDDPTRIEAAFDLVDEITADHGLVTSEMVPALLSAQPGSRRGGFRLARHDY